MLHFVSSVYDWFVNSLGWIWLAIFFGAVAAELFWLYVVVIRAWDIRYDPELQDKRKSGKLRKKKIDLKKAWPRRVSIPMYGVPVYAAWVAAIVVLCIYTSWTTYLAIATLCLIATPISEIWLLGIARRVKAKKGKSFDKDFKGVVASYYKSGLKLPDEDELEPWFEDRLAWLNFLQRFRIVFHIFRFWRIGLEMLSALTWPITLLVAIFDDLDKVESYDEKAPKWRADRGITSL